MKETIDEAMLNKRLEEQKQNETIYINKVRALETEISSYEQILENTQKDIMSIKAINVDDIDDFETRQEFVRKYIHKMIVTKVPDEYRTVEITFEYTHPVITTRSKYIYTYKNQQDKKVYRINEDNTKDLIYYNDKKSLRDSKTGKFVKQ
jgi:hypothetical protein